MTDGKLRLRIRIWAFAAAMGYGMWWLAHDSLSLLEHYFRPEYADMRFGNAYLVERVIVDLLLTYFANKQIRQQRALLEAKPDIA